MSRLASNLLWHLKEKPLQICRHVRTSLLGTYMSLLRDTCKRETKRNTPSKSRLKDVGMCVCLFGVYTCLFCYTCKRETKRNAPSKSRLTYVLVSLLQVLCSSVFDDRSVVHMCLSHITCYICLSHTTFHTCLSHITSDISVSHRSCLGVSLTFDTCLSHITSDICLSHITVDTRLSHITSDMSLS